MILFTADIHLNALPRDNYRHKWQKHLRSLVEKHRVEVVIILGDLTDHKDEHPAVLVNQIVDHLTALSRLCAVIILRGNHDYTSLEEAAFFQFLRHIPNIYWYSQPTVTSGHPPLFKLGKIGWLPHTSNHERDWRDFDFAGLNWAFAHVTFTGAVGESGRKLEGVPTDIFSRRTRVLSGDVHTPQSFDNITYVGAPYTVHFGDDFKPRVLLLDKSETLKSIPSPGPNKRLLKVRSASLTADLKARGRYNEGDILKVEIELASGDFARQHELKEKVYAWGEEMGYVIHMTRCESPTVTRVEKEPAPQPTHRSDQEMTRRYGKDTGLDKATIAEGLDLCGDE